MMNLTAAGFLSLIHSEKENTSATYWESRVISRQETRQVRSESSIDRCFDGWNGWSPDEWRTETYTEHVTVYILQLEKLLAEKGYTRHYYPLLNDLPNGYSINTRGCQNVFAAEKLNKECLEELKWCLENNRIDQKELTPILAPLKTKQLQYLYQAKISTYHKDLIYRLRSECDPVRLIKEKINVSFEEGVSLSEDGNLLESQILINVLRPI